MFTPVHSFVGGLTIAGATYELLAENGLVFGASGFFHRTIRATSRSLTSSLEPISKERDSSWSESDQLATAAIVGLVTGGVLLRIYDDQATHAFGATIFDPPSTSGLFGTVVAGFLVGYGTRLCRGCTSGHMLSGVSRLSKRSWVSTITFFITAVATVQALKDFGPSPASIPPGPSDVWSYPNWKVVLAAQSPAFLSFIMSRAVRKPYRSLRVAVSFLCGLQFSFGLALTGMLRPSKVVGFMTFPSSTAHWDPSLGLVAFGAVLPLFLSYYFNLKPEIERGCQPRLSSKWSIPTGRNVDIKLVIGSILFGLGWGATGMCPGPAIVSITSAAITGMPGAWKSLLFLVSAAAGGLLSY